MSERRDPEQPDRRRDPLRGDGRRKDDRPAEWVSISDYARIYGVDRGTVYKWLAAQLLRTYRMDRCVRIRNLPPDEHRAVGVENC